MILFLLLIVEKSLAFNQDLKAVHYSIVTAGIDDELTPGMYTSNLNQNSSSVT